MAYDPTATLAAITSFLKSQGRVGGGNVQIGEPKDPPAGRISAAVFMEGIRTPESVLDAPVRIYDVAIRLYRNFTEDGTATEIELARAVGELWEDLEGDFDLGASIRNVDVAGIYGQGLTASWGYLDVAGRMYRTCDVSVPLVVDPAAATLVA